MSSRLIRFVSYYRPYWRLFLLDMVCAFVVAGITLTLPLCVRFITETLLAAPGPDAIPAILTMGGVMMLLVALLAACGIFVDYQGHLMGTLMERDIRNALFAHFQRLSFRFYDENRTGTLMSRLTNDLWAMSEMFHHVPEEIAIALLKFVGAFVILLTINVPVTLVIFSMMPFMAWFAVHHNRRLRATLYEGSQRMGDINATVEDTLAGIRVVQSFGREPFEQQRFSRANDQFVATRAAGYRSEAYFYEGLGAFVQTLTIAVVVLGGVAIAHDTLSLTDLLTYLLFVGILVDPIHKLMNLARLLQEGDTGFRRFLEMIDISPDIMDAPSAVDLPPVEGSIRFENVSFRYTEGGEFVLRDVSLSIHPGEYVALVGPSGVGKTTLCSLLPRFYEVTEGCILLDGMDIRDVTLHSLRRQIGVVQQDVYLFAGTVAENIGYGDLNAPMEAIIEAAQQSNAHDFIMSLPAGYQTYIGQRGVRLSGGQKQRLSIARVFLKNPPILILDEATSALDNESERAVQQSLEQLRRGRTTLVIAHRLSTIRNADRILVLTEAGIEEQGTHEALLSAGGTYASLYLGRG